MVALENTFSLVEVFGAREANIFSSYSRYYCVLVCKSSLQFGLYVV